MENIYYYVIPGVLFLLFCILLFLCIIRKNDFQIIESDFKENLDSLFRKTVSNFYIFIKEFDKRTKRTLEEELNLTIQRFKNLNDEFERLLDHQTELNKINIYLNNEIKKRDAIIERKTRQIKRLKNDDI